MRYALPVLALALIGLSPASAEWSTAASGSAVTGADVMSAPSGLTAACTSKNANSDVLLRWTASADLYVTGYSIVRQSSSGGTATFDVTGRTTESYTDAVVGGAGQTFTYTVQATSTGTLWRSTPTTASGRPSYTNGRNSGCTVL